VLASDADAGAFPALKLLFIDESPLLHNPLCVIRMYYYR